MILCDGWQLNTYLIIYITRINTINYFSMCIRMFHFQKIMNIVESGIKHHNQTNQNTHDFLEMEHSYTH
jgi:hypothetical protein